jgi:hypothetical protein
MTSFLFVFSIAAVLATCFAWCFRNLSKERWQIIGAMPVCKDKNGQWQGVNFTYYGFFNAVAVTLAVLMVFVLLAATGLAPMVIGSIVLGVVCLFTPASKWIARLVEKKKYTFSIGGASFAGLVVTPLVLQGINTGIAHWTAARLPVMSVMAAITVGYALGEGIGRLACISYGCCYGKPLASLPPVWQHAARPFCVAFYGGTKKAVYAGGLEGQPVLAIQGFTAVLYTATALSGAWLFLAGHASAAYLTCVIVTQVWRVLSEFLRADYRGNGRISAYQMMAAAAAVLAVVWVLILPSERPHTDLIKGLRILWNPGIILTCQLLWIGIFLYLGRSSVTAARITFFVRSDRI